MGAADNGLIMVREEAGSSNVLLSIMTGVPPTHELPARTEILEVQGVVEIDG